ncbi:glycoside hydrolase family 28 protein [Hymenobacter convexus]|uniref:glycoside hydrolase family 28 protein n=1 Tax=Hymenobacter sp. CA1UV-4 TaxID=3063782 RepID=UPI0027134C6A|nr:glycoside hydrolase family 28 protein [Hymenobacter sp. CA1UV-4]MDO7851703.1 glycoside hydrolase family 28 protein [Hymenobacter sp. CA1UV-4]
MAKNTTSKTLKFLLWVSFLAAFAARGAAALPGNAHLLVAPGTLTENSVTVLWDKQPGAGKAVYELALNGKAVATTSKTNYTFSQLAPATAYAIQLRVKPENAGAARDFGTLKFKTAAKGKVYNVLDYGAKNDTAVVNTKAIQAAINACAAGGTVLIPKGTFVSGALFLKSNMTLRIEGMLKGSRAPDDYLPMILNRFEGWELTTYASLLNAGTLNRNGYTVSNLRITGGGTISGGGRRLGDAMTKAHGLRSRGRLICLLSCEDVSISHLTVTEPPCWTIHYIYSHNISCHDLAIVTKGIHNGDGIDPDSSTDSYIFNCTFDTGDDCIAIKSGKNPEGFAIGKPTRNVRITDCDFLRGHGISIGSEMSGGVSDVLVQDCKAGALLHGMQIKGTKDRGGYVRNVTVTDCQLRQITIFSAVNYNNDGAPAPEVPTFEQFVFRNIDLSEAAATEPAININGFKDPAHRLRNVTFSHILLPENAKVVINDAEQVKFTDVKAGSGAKPAYSVANSADILY